MVSGVNALAVECFRPVDSAFPPTNNDTDLAITFVDWYGRCGRVGLGGWGKGGGVELWVDISCVVMREPAVIVVDSVFWIRLFSIRAPPPPDNNMGIWREVEVAVLAGPVSVRYPLVRWGVWWRGWLI